MEQVITGIPAAQVGRVVQDFIDDGKTNVIAQLMDDGTYTVSAA